MAKPTVKLGGVTLAGNRSITWRLQTGTTPYQTTMQVHKSDWEKLKSKVAKPLNLEIVDADGTKTTIREVYILEERPSDSPNRVTFVVADRRWKWRRVFVSRDYNHPKRTGDRTIINPRVPVGTEVVVDQYDFKAFSLKTGQTKWTPQEAVEDVLRVITENEDNKWFVESFPIKDTGSEDGQFTLQNIVLRDSGDVALSRILSYIPGAAVYITVLGQIRVIDAADLQAAEKHLDTLPPETWSGEAPRMIDRKGIRPGRVLVHYQREVECLFEFEDDWSGATSVPNDPSAPFLQNVIPTVDPSTTMEIYDPITNTNNTVKVPAGTWVEVQSWLETMDTLKPSGSWPWIFDMAREHWFAGDLEGIWFGSNNRGVQDDVVDGNVMSRIQAFKQHFRQTFRINPRYMDRIRNLQAIRVANMDPVTGARSPAGVWGQATIIPSWKGHFVHKRRDKEKAGEWILVDNTPLGANTIANPPSAARVSLIDRDQGIFRVDWLTSPYGTESAVIPCHTSNFSGDKRVPARSLADQDSGIVGPSMRREGRTNNPFLSNAMKMNVIVTITAGAPNNKEQFHVEAVEASDIKELFRSEFRIQGGQGPDLEVFIPPGEAMARFAWEKDELAKQTIRIMLGTDFSDPTAAGLPKGTRRLSGFQWVNEQREVPSHAKSVAAEALAPFADNVMGQVATRVPKDTLQLKGNMTGAAIRVAASPSAKVDTVHSFPGQQQPISRFALMPDSTRRLVLGIIGGVTRDE